MINICENERVAATRKKWHAMIRLRKIDARLREISWCRYQMGDDEWDWACGEAANLIAEWYVLRGDAPEDYGRAPVDSHRENENDGNIDGLVKEIGDAYDRLIAPKLSAATRRLR